MGKALVLKGVNFFANRVATVEFVDKPCTGITLDQSTATISNTLTLTATPTPSNTTDEVTWSSSDEHVAIVNNGVVTAISNGTAAIIATCGMFSARCTVTVNLEYKIYKGYCIVVNPNNGVLLESAAELQLSNSVSYGGKYGLYPAVGSKGAPSGIKELYPIKIPNEAKTIIVTVSSDYAPLVVYYDKDMKANVSSANYDDCTKVLDGETPLAGTAWSISAWEYGDKTFTISDVTGVDSFTLSFYCKNSTAYDNFSAASVGVSFGYT